MHLIDFDHPYNLAEASICTDLLPTKQVVKHATNQLTKHIDLLNDYGTGEGDIGFRKKLVTILKQRWNKYRSRRTSHYKWWTASSKFNYKYIYRCKGCCCYRGTNLPRHYRYAGNQRG